MTGRSSGTRGGIAVQAAQRLARQRRVGVEVERRAVLAARLLHGAPLLQQGSHPEVAVGEGGAVAGRHAAQVAGEKLLGALQALAGEGGGAGELDLRVGIAGIEAQSGIEGGEGALVLAGAGERHAKSDLRPGVGGELRRGRQQLTLRRGEPLRVEKHLGERQAAAQAVAPLEVRGVRLGP